MFRVRPGRRDDIDHVFLDRLGEVDLARGGLSAEELLRGQHLIDRLEWVDVSLRIEDGDLFELLWVAEMNTHEEAVELCLGKRERALILDRVLRGPDEERLRQLVDAPVDGCLVLILRLQHRTLVYCRGPVV